MASPEPTTPKGRRTRTALIKAACEVLAEQGYVELRMSDVAKTAGLSTGALYRYFENKEDLFTAVIADIHEEMFVASRSSKADFAKEPYAALYTANLGYLAHYYENRDVLRAFMEATTVDERFRQIWWKMRNRHVNRFAHAIKSIFGIEQVNGIDIVHATEAMASMVEQCAYTWFAFEEMNKTPISVKDAAETVTRIWYNTFFVDQSSSQEANAAKLSSVEQS